MKPEDKILEVLKQIDKAQGVAPNKSILYLEPPVINSEITELEIKSILEKLEFDKVIEIIKTPYEVWADVGNENEPTCYTLKTKDGFEAYFNALYEKASFGIRRLSQQNYYRVYAVAEEINQELNITKGNKACIKATTGTPNLWKGINLKSISLADIKIIKQKSLEFLKSVEAIDSYKLDDYVKSDQMFIVCVTRRKFDTSFLDLIMNSARYKKTSLVKKSKPIAKKPNPIEYDDEHGKVKFNGNSKKLFAPDSVEGFLFYKIHLADGARVRTSDLLLGLDSKGIDTDKNKSNRTLTNAKDRINKKLSSIIGSENVIEYELEKFWLNSKFLSKNSPYIDGN